MKKLLMAAIAGLVIGGCESKVEPNEGKSIEEIRVENQDDVSKIIRSPITAQGLEDTTNVAKLTFSEERYNFGETFEGDVINHTFHFTNTGKVPLLINDARSTCGCTVPKWPKEAIAPGEKGVIEVEFNTKDKKGMQEKPVIITANTYPNVTKIYVEGNVIPKGE